MTVHFRSAIAIMLLAAGGLLAQSTGFEVATIKQTAPDWKGGRFITMPTANRFVVRYYTVKSLVGAAYNLNPYTISGGPGWVGSDPYDILAVAPGETRPSLDKQMEMLQELLADRFKLTFHREQKEMPVYALTVSKNGIKVKQSTEPPDSAPYLINTVFPDHVHLPARNATIEQFTSMMQRAVVDRPIVNKTGLAGRYDFDLDWTSDETQFGGQLPPPTGEPAKPGLFAAMQQQLGLKLEPARELVSLLVIDRVERPSEN